jgi:hypothetical protein
MGWTMCYIAVKNGLESEVLKKLRLETVAKAVHYNLPERDEIIGFTSEQGWYLLLAAEPDLFDRENELRELSKNTDIVLGQEVESVAYSRVGLFALGVRAWQLDYAGWQADALISTEGVLPEFVQRLVNDSVEQVGGGAQYEVALTVFAGITGIDWKSYGSLKPIASAKYLSLEQ